MCLLLTFVGGIRTTDGAAPAKGREEGSTTADLAAARRIYDRWADNASAYEAMARAVLRGTPPRCATRPSRDLASVA